MLKGLPERAYPKLPGEVGLMRRRVGTGQPCRCCFALESIPVMNTIITQQPPQGRDVMSRTRRSSSFSAAVLCMSLLASAAAFAEASSTPNPVLYNAGNTHIFKFNGEYFLTGNRLDG